MVLLVSMKPSPNGQRALDELSNCFALSWENHLSYNKNKSKTGCERDGFRLAGFIFIQKNN